MSDLQYDSRFQRYNGNGGFTPAIAPSMVRRQFRASLVILAVVVTATLSAAITGNLQPVHAERAAVTLTYQPPGTTLQREAQAPLVNTGLTKTPRG